MIKLLWNYLLLLEEGNKPKSLYPKKEKTDWTFVIMGTALTIFFALCIVALLTGFHAVDSGWTYNGGL